MCYWDSSLQHRSWDAVNFIQKSLFELIRSSWSSRVNFILVPQIGRSLGSGNVTESWDHTRSNDPWLLRRWSLCLLKVLWQCWHLLISANAHCKIQSFTLHLIIFMIIHSTHTTLFCWHKFRKKQTWKKRNKERCTKFVILSDKV